MLAILGVAQTIGEGRRNVGEVRSRDNFQRGGRALGKPSYIAITVERCGDADWCTLNHPEQLNALDHAMVDDQLAYFGAAAEDPPCRVIVLQA